MKRQYASQTEVTVEKSKLLMPECNAVKPDAGPYGMLGIITLILVFLATN
jgi:hypothetical protein